MKAIFQDKYGSTDDVPELKEIDQPVVKDDEVLVLVHSASVHIRHWIMTRGVPYLKHPAIGLRKPRNSLPREDIAGKVKAVYSPIAYKFVDKKRFKRQKISG